MGKNYQPQGASLPDFSHQHCDRWILHLKVGTVIAWEASKLTAVIFLDKKTPHGESVCILAFGVWGNILGFQDISGESWGESQDLNQKNK